MADLILLKILQHDIKVFNSEEAEKIEEKYEGKPRGFIQWKGTEVCMDIHCKCGNSSHIDDDFAYHVKCPKCNTVYRCNPNIELIEIEEKSNIDIFVEKTIKVKKEQNISCLNFAQ